MKYLAALNIGMTVNKTMPNQTFTFEIWLIRRKMKPEGRTELSSVVIFIVM